MEELEALEVLEKEQVLELVVVLELVELDLILMVMRGVLVMLVPLVLQEVLELGPVPEEQVILVEVGVVEVQGVLLVLVIQL